MKKRTKKKMKKIVYSVIKEAVRAALAAVLAYFGLTTTGCIALDHSTAAFAAERD